MTEVNVNATPSDTTSGGIRAGGVWWQTPGLAALIGLGPLLAASRTFAGGLVLGLASLAVLCSSNLLVSALAGWISPRFRLGAYLLLVAALVTAVDLLLQAWWFDLYGQIGQFVPLIIANGLILTRAESFAAHHRLWPAFLDGLGYGLGFMLLLAGLGAVRELLAPALLLATLPAGAFFLLAALLAFRALWLRRRGAA